MRVSQRNLFDASFFFFLLDDEIIKPFLLFFDNRFGCLMQINCQNHHPISMLLDILDLHLTLLLRTTQNLFTVYNFIQKLRILPMGKQSLGNLFLIYADVDRTGRW